MSGIDEQYGSLPFLGLVQAWLQLGFQEFRLFLGVGLGRNSSYFAVAQIETFFKNRRTWVRPRLMPVNFSMAA